MANRDESYAELHCLSNFSFLRGASHPGELVAQAAALGYAGLAITDECSLAGVVRAHTAARTHALKLVVGAELVCEGGLKVVALAADRRAYAALAALISAARRAAPKGSYRLDRTDLERHLEASSCLLLWVPDVVQVSPAPSQDTHATGGWLAERFRGRLWIAVELVLDGVDRLRLARCLDLSAALDVPPVAAGGVLMHRRERRPLHDTLTAIRLKTPVDRLGAALPANAERSLRSRRELARRYPAELLRESVAILERCRFSLDELRYEYPRELVPEGETPAGHLRALVTDGQRWRWPAGTPPRVLGLIEHELTLIAELRYEPYFLTVHDIVRFARRAGILCQGRGSAANSVVCFCLGITEVDPARMTTLVERFISKERNEPPDIDVDFEHERREEVIQYIYAKYTRARAALAATVITYRPRSAIRDVGKALGLDELQARALARTLQWWDGTVDRARVAEAGFDPDSARVRTWLALTAELIGFPRHLSQHVGGFVISAGPLDELVPVENAAMPERTVIQWDKDDLEELRLLKVDVLGLGMLTAIRKSFALIEGHSHRQLTMASIPAEDPEVYAMIGRADTMGVFQIESRAQMAMLPRLKPRSFYDLVIEVAIIRPGPIQGDMVHPYLRRRNGEEAVTYPSEAVRGVLERTLGVPIFQEQVMQLAIVAAGFTPGEADGLRRAMAAWRRRGDLGVFGERLIGGMRERGYPERFAAQIFEQIKGFGEYGFPESHAASFALLVYVSAWLKHYEPAAFCCALLNSQPMGFYAPAQLIRSAREHGVLVRPVDVAASASDSTLEPDVAPPALRLGLRLVKGLSGAGAARIVAARQTAPFRDVHDLAERAALSGRDSAALAAAGALATLAGHRHRAQWQVTGLSEPTALLGRPRFNEGLPLLKAPGEADDIEADYRQLGVSLRRHPLALLRPRLAAGGMAAAAEVAAAPAGSTLRTAGLVITRQRPSSASGVTFVTLEDETGYVNLIVWEKVAERCRQALFGAALLAVTGRVQKEGQVLHVVALGLEDLTAWLGGLSTRSRDFR